MAVGKHAHQKIRRQDHLEHIKPAADPVVQSDRCSTAALLHGAKQTIHIAPAEIETLASHGMAAVGGFADQHATPPVKAASQQPLLRESSGLIKQTVRFNPLGENSGQLIEKCTVLQCAVRDVAVNCTESLCAALCVLLCTTQLTMISGVPILL